VSQRRGELASGTDLELGIDRVDMSADRPRGYEQLLTNLGYAHVSQSGSSHGRPHLAQSGEAMATQAILKFIRSVALTVAR